MTDRTASLSRWALALYLVLLVIGTHLPKETAAQWTPPEQNHSDKLLHFCAYAGVGFLGAWVVTHLLQRPPALWLLGLLAAFAALDEATQMWPGLGREADVLDFTADLAGACCGWLAFGVWRRRSGYVEEPPPSQPAA